MSFPFSNIPIDYSTPPFPSLYWPIRAPPGTAQYLYSATDSWRFTLYWTLITFGLVHSAVAAWAVLMQFHSAVSQRRLQRRGTGSKTRDASASASASANVAGNAAAAAAADDDGSIRSNSNPSRARVSTDTATKSPHLPQPLLISTSPVLSTLGWVWIIPVVYLTVGGIEAILSGSLVGLIAGAVYNAGYFRMSTWMPFLWGIISCLVVILGSFRIQGGL